MIEILLQHHSSIRKQNGLFAQKELRCLLVMFVMLLLPSGAWAAAGDEFTVNKLKYDVNIDQKSVTVTGHEYGTGATGTLTIPEKVTYGGTTYAVTTIGESAFESCDFTGDLTIPNSVTTIGDNAFKYCSNLTTVYVMRNDATSEKPLTEANNNIFENCNQLTTIYVPAAAVEDYKKAWSAYSSYIKGGYVVTTSGDVTADVPIAEVGQEVILSYSGEVPSGSVVVYTAKTSDGNIDLTDGMISGSTLTMHDFNVTVAMTFTGTCGDRYVNDGKNVKWSYDSATKTLTISGEGEMEMYLNTHPWKDFGSDIQKIVVEEGVTNISKRAFVPCVNVTSASIAASVTSIGEEAFKSCEKLSSVTFAKESKLTSIGEEAFKSCESLTSITIPASVTSIGTQAFLSCYKLATVTFADGIKLTSIGNGVFSNCKGLISITIPASVTSIGDEAFDRCESLSAIAIPASVTSIGLYAFRACLSMTAINVNENNKAFKSVDGVLFDYNGTTLIRYPAKKTATSYAVPDGVTTIGDYAFDYCNSLTSITIAASVTSIENYAFFFCKNLEKVYVLPTVTPTLGEYNPFNGCESLAAIIVPATAVTDYMQALSGYSGIIKAGYVVTTSGDATADVPIAEKGQEVAIGYSGEVPEGSVVVYTAKKKTNDDTTDVTADVISGSTLTMPEYDVTVEATLAATSGYCGDPDDNNGQNVTWSYDIAKKTLTISGTGKMKDFLIGTNTTNSPWFAFSPQLQTVVIEPGVTSIGDNSFRFSNGLTTITIPEGVTYIGQGAFNSCIGLTAITIPASVTSIGKSAFSSCIGLTAITIPASVTSIGNSSFEKCTNLEKACVLNEEPPLLGQIPFYDCDNITIYVPENAVKDYQQSWSDYSGIIQPIRDINGVAVVSFAEGQTYKTYYNADKDCLIPDGVTAYIVTDASGDHVTIKEVSYLKKGVPLLLAKTDGKTNAKVIDPDESFDGNMLAYAEDAVKTTGQEYVLYMNEFLKATGEIPIGKCYLKVNAFTGARLRIGGETTSLSPDPSPKGEGRSCAQWYDLQGRKVSDVSGKLHKGMYIVDGQKRVVK